MPAADDFVEIAYITKTHGLKGEVQVAFSYDQPERLKLKSVFVELNKKMVPFFVAKYKISQKHLAYFSFEDIDHIDKAQPLAKKKVYLTKAMMPKREKAELTYEDLKGFEVLDKNHGELGKIIEVREYPQQFIATVLHKGKEVMFPLTDDLLLAIDEKNQIIQIEMPDGLLDIYLE